MLAVTEVFVCIPDDSFAKIFVALDVAGAPLVVVAVPVGRRAEVEPSETQHRTFGVITLWVKTLFFKIVNDVGTLEYVASAVVEVVVVYLYTLHLVLVSDSHAEPVSTLLDALRRRILLDKVPYLVVIWFLACHLAVQVVDLCRIHRAQYVADGLLADTFSIESLHNLCALPGLGF